MVETEDVDRILRIEVMLIFKSSECTRVFLRKLLAYSPPVTFDGSIAG